MDIQNEIENYYKKQNYEYAILKWPFSKFSIWTLEKMKLVAQGMPACNQYVYFH